jgi:hypothetical protein
MSFILTLINPICISGSGMTVAGSDMESWKTRRGTGEEVSPRRGETHEGRRIRLVRGVGLYVGRGVEGG